MHCQESRKTMNEQKLKEKIKQIESGKEIEGFITKKGKLYKFKDNKLLRVLKEDEIDSVLYMLHDHPIGGHFGMDGTYNKIKERFYWKGMKKDVEAYVKSCDQCQKRGNKGGKGLLNPIKINQIFERVGIDFVGPLPKTRKGNKYICVITEYLTKWPEAKAMKKATAQNVVEFLYETIICRFGCPQIIQSDRGSHFNNQIMEDLCKKFMIKHKLSSPYHPQTNGLVERFNRTLCETLAKLILKENQWDQHINSALFAYRTMKQGTTKRTPFYMMYGKEATLPIDEIGEIVEINKEKELLHRTYQIINIQEDREEVLNTIKESQQTQKENHDCKIKEITFKIAEKVLLKDSAKEKQWSGKLQPKWKGPYYVHDISGKGTYRLRTIEGQVLKAPYNVKQLKRYHERKED